MSHISRTYRAMASGYTGEVHAPSFSEGILRHVTNLIVLFFGLLNGLLGLRFLLKLMALSETHPLADTVYSITSPFVGAFKSLMLALSFRGGELEFFSLLAIAIYTALGWLIIQLLWLLFARIK